MIRPYEAADRSAVLALNKANEPEVGPLNDAKLDLLIDEALSFLVVDVDGQVVGIMILLGPGGTYSSPNYRWFSERYENFVYVDRIALAESVRGQGWGPTLYARFEALARERGVATMAAEVNTVPLNERSLRFHDIAGFDEVGRCKPYGGDEEVAMLVKTVPAA
jgi:predicted GNAT superfamily acetyltransferase